MKNNLYRKGFIVPILLGIIALLIIGGGLYAYKKEKAEAPVVTNENKGADINNKEIPIVKTSNIKTFKLGDLEFSYPDILTLNKNGEVVSLGHSIPLKHVNSCDLKDGLTINDLSDFGASFKLFDKNLKDSVLSNESDYFSKNYIKNDTFVLSDGFVEKFSIGNLNGFKISMGLEGCGVDNYYFPISSTKTLFISKNWYAQTYQSIDLPKLDSIPGFISKNQEEQIFKDILSSTSGLGQKETISVKLYFPNSVIDKGFLDCNVVRSTTRTIPYTLAVGEASLKELIKGPISQELSQGFQTQIDSNVTIKSLSIKNGTAYVDFSKDLQKKNVGLCAGQFIDAQIRQTLLQFPTIKNVVISIEGNKDFVQP